MERCTERVPYGGYQIKGVVLVIGDNKAYKAAADKLGRIEDEEERRCKQLQNRRNRRP